MTQDDENIWKGFRRLYPHPLIEFGALIIITAMYLYNAFSYELPVGYAGLFSIMVEGIIEQPLPMPSSVPHYGPGGMPFAYPPFGLYLTSFFVGILNIPVFSYLRWAPPLVTIGAFTCAYFFFRQIAQDRTKATIAVLLVAAAEISYVTHATAAGMVRSWALVFAVSGAYFGLRAYEAKKRWSMVGFLAALFLALTIMTHLSYAGFLLIGIVVMAFVNNGFHLTRRSLWTMGFILIGALVLSSPWWGTLLLRHGLQVFLNASGTHGTLAMLDRATGNLILVPVEMVRWFVNLGRSWWPFFFAGLSLIGFVYSTWKRLWFLPVWMLMTVLFLGETDRFQIFISSMLIAVVLVDLARIGDLSPRASRWVKDGMFLSPIFLVLILAPIVGQGFVGIRRSREALSSNLLAMAAWVQANTPEDTEYIYLGEDHDVPEWLPYLMRRTPIIAHWGAEWKGNYNTQKSLTRDVENCLSRQSAECVFDLIEQEGTRVRLLVLHNEYTSLRDALASHPRWDEVYESGSFVLYEMDE